MANSRESVVFVCWQAKSLLDLYGLWISVKLRLKKKVDDEKEMVRKLHH